MRFPQIQKKKKKVSGWEAASICLSASYGCVQFVVGINYLDVQNVSSPCSVPLYGSQQGPVLVHCLDHIHAISGSLVN